MLLDWCTGLLKPQRDIVEVVPSEAMTDSFRAYITASNDFLGRRQIASLKKLHNFIKVTPTARECSAPRTESHDQSLQPLTLITCWLVVAGYITAGRGPGGHPLAGDCGLGGAQHRRDAAGALPPRGIL